MVLLRNTTFLAAKLLCVKLSEAEPRVIAWQSQAAHHSSAKLNRA